jgi:hypothetical protein
MITKQEYRKVKRLLKHRIKRYKKLSKINSCYNVYVDKIKTDIANLDAIYDTVKREIYVKK